MEKSADTIEDLKHEQTYLAPKSLKARHLPEAKNVQV